MSTLLDKWKRLAAIENARMLEVAGKPNFGRKGGQGGNAKDFMRRRRDRVRKMWEAGKSVTEITETLEIARNTVVQDLSACGLWTYGGGRNVARR